MYLCMCKHVIICGSNTFMSLAQSRPSRSQFSPICLASHTEFILSDPGVLSDPIASYSALPNPTLFPKIRSTLSYIIRSVPILSVGSHRIRYISSIHSGYFYSASSSLLLLRHSTDTVPAFHAEAPQATVSEGFAQDPYVATRAGVEPMTLRTKGVNSTNTPHTPHNPR